MLTARELVHVAANTLIIYVSLIVGLRLLGRRQMGQLSVVDLTIVIILGSAVETAMIKGNTSLTAGIISAGTLLSTNRILTLLLTRSTRLRHLVEGVPLLLVRDGQFIEEHLRRSGLTEEDVLQAIRERGKESVEEVKFAVLESDGEINVIPKEGTAGGGKEKR